jgi:hypothetical protein
MLTAPFRPAVLAKPFTAGASKPSMIAMMAITASSSTNEKPFITLMDFELMK